MQPQTPQRPVMDVKAPVRPADQPLAHPQPQIAAQHMTVHEPPKEDNPELGSQPEPAKGVTKQPTLEKTLKAPVRQQATKADRLAMPLPIGAIIFAIFAMIALAVLAVVVYLQSQ